MSSDKLDRTIEVLEEVLGAMRSLRDGTYTGHRADLHRYGSWLEYAAMDLEDVVMHEPQKETA